ncbi:hypothetical protein RCL1_001218 [Eukaryota sp. TZLM3-RCL]
MAPSTRSLSKRSKPPDKVSLSSSVLSSGSNKSSVPIVLSDKKSRIKQRCGCCKEEGHNRSTCPTLRERQEEARASACELDIVNSTLPTVDGTTSEDFVIPPHPPIKSKQSNSINHICGVCNLPLDLLSTSENFFCFNCASKDLLRPPVKIPIQVSPKSSIPLSVAFRSFTLSLSSGNWDIGHVWRYYFDNNKSKANIAKKFSPTQINKDKVIRNQLLRGRYGSAKANLFSSELAPVNEDSLKQLMDLHPVENFSSSKPLSSNQYWSTNPIKADELLKAILHLPSGKAAGPSGISFDLLKSVVRQNSFIVDDLAPKQFTASRLIALRKPNGKIRPIAVGESLYRLLSSLVFNRVAEKSKSYFSPFQFGIKTIDGASVAALTTDLFFKQNSNNCVFNLDFKNAFNSVLRGSIQSELQHKFPEVESFFHCFYSGTSDLVYDVHNLPSSSGVKQGDPLGPFLFCLSIQPILNLLKSKFPQLEMIAYIDDISLIVPFEIINEVSQLVSSLYLEIGLHLNVSKCFLIANSSHELSINGVSVPFINYSTSSFHFLGCFLGFRDHIVNDLNSYLKSIELELDEILKLEIEKHWKFFLWKVCSPTIICPFGYV